MVNLKNRIELLFTKIKENPVGKFLFSLFSEMQEDRLSVQAANMTYYMLLALFPFLIFLFGVFSYTSLTIDTVKDALLSILPMQTVNLILGTVQEVLNNDNSVLFSLAMIGAIWSALQATGALITGVNRAYGVTESRSILVTTGINLFVIISIPIFSIMSFLFIAMGKLLLAQFTIWFDLSMGFQETISFSRYIVAIFMLVFYFTLFYKFVPNLRLSFKKIFIGALFTTFGWIGTSMLFSLYITNFANYTRLYGSLGSIIALLLWINLSSMIILIGAEIIMLISGGEEFKERKIKEQKMKEIKMKEKEIREKKIKNHK